MEHSSTQLFPSLRAVGSFYGAFSKFNKESEVVKTGERAGTFSIDVSSFSVRVKDTNAIYESFIHLQGVM